MKTLFFMTAIILQSVVGAAQLSVSDYLVKSQATISRNSADGYYSKYIMPAVLPNGVRLAAAGTFTVYTLNNVDFIMIEVPVTSESNVANLMFIAVDLKNKVESIFFKKHTVGQYEVFDKSLVKLYTIDFSGSVKFINQTGTSAKQSCYSKCRAAAYAQIESEFLSDFACSFNPCGMAIAIYCKIQCW